MLFDQEKAAGRDRTPISIIKQSIRIITEFLVHTINLSITHDIVPDRMKTTLVAPLLPLKPVIDHSTIYRLVSILPGFSKFLEKDVYSRLYNYLSKLDILCDNQFGFRKNHSTSLPLIDLLYMKKSDCVLSFVFMFL